MQPSSLASLDYVRDYETFGFRRLAVLGTGSFGVVDLVRLPPDLPHQLQLQKIINAAAGDTIALKTIAKSSHTPTADKKPSPVTERDILQLVATNGSCEFINQFYGTICTGKYIYFILEPSVHGDLFSHRAEGLLCDIFQLPAPHDPGQGQPQLVEESIIQRRLQKRDDILRRFVAMLIAGLHYLHQLDILYRVLNPENVLVTTQGALKLCDFGLSRRLRIGEKATTICGVPDYWPPEFLDATAGGHDHFVDWWMLGILIHEMLFEDVPWDNMGGGSGGPEARPDTGSGESDRDREFAIGKCTRIVEAGRAARLVQGSCVDLRLSVSPKHRYVPGRIRGLVSALLSGEPNKRLPWSAEDVGQWSAAPMEDSSLLSGGACVGLNSWCARDGNDTNNYHSRVDALML